MIVFATLVEGSITRDAEACAIAPIAAHVERCTRAGTSGATVRFEGIVRDTEPRGDGVPRALKALRYSSYDPMAQQALDALALDIARAHQLNALITVHSRGEVAVGEISFVLTIAACHRAQSLRAMGEFIDRLKQDVPLWKQPVWRECE